MRLRFIPPSRRASPLRARCRMQPRLATPRWPLASSPLCLRGACSLTLGRRREDRAADLLRGFSAACQNRPSPQRRRWGGRAVCLTSLLHLRPLPERVLRSIPHVEKWVSRLRLRVLFPSSRSTRTPRHRWRAPARTRSCRLMHTRRLRPSPPSSAPPPFHLLSPSPRLARRSSCLLQVRTRLRR
uniref:Uncharacterized protein n=1 Tax=Toxoplasma gondii TgCATBr9 TaxID=943120 RepID=A0A2T6J4X6_TOXGO|nr:hypothetical protein TGBR9_380500 [Toxoplasma gondii TgCATBr9]